MTTKSRFTKFVQKKFGSVERFKKITRTRQIDLDYAFKKKDKAAGLALMSKAKTSNAVPIKGDLTEAMREDVRIAIYTNYKNINHFCLEHRYTNSFISELLNGKYKRVSTRIKGVFKTLKIHNDEWSK